MNCHVIVPVVLFFLLNPFLEAALSTYEPILPPRAQPEVCAFLPCYRPPRAQNRVNLKALEEQSLRRTAFNHRQETEPRLALAYSYLNRKDTRKARQLAEALFRVKALPLWQILVLKSEISLEEGKIQNAAHEAWDAVLNTHAKEPQATFLHARCLFALSRYSDALYSLNLSRIQNPQNLQELEWLDTLCRLALQENHPALLKMIRFKEELKDWPPLLMGLSIAYARLGEKDGVEFHLRKLALSGFYDPFRLHLIEELRPHLKALPTGPALRQMEENRLKRKAYLSIQNPNPKSSGI